MPMAGLAVPRPAAMAMEMALGSVARRARRHGSKGQVHGRGRGPTQRSQKIVECVDRSRAEIDIERQRPILVRAKRKSMDDASETLLVRCLCVLRVEPAP